MNFELIFSYWLRNTWPPIAWSFLLRILLIPRCSYWWRCWQSLGCTVKFTNLHKFSDYYSIITQVQTYKFCLYHTKLLWTNIYSRWFHFAIRYWLTASAPTNFRNYKFFNWYRNRYRTLTARNIFKTVKFLANLFSHANKSWFTYFNFTEKQNKSLRNLPLL